MEMGVEPKIGPKMNGKNNGRPYEEMDALGGVFPLYLETPKISKPFPKSAWPLDSIHGIKISGQKTPPKFNSQFASEKWW